MLCQERTRLPLLEEGNGVGTVIVKLIHILPWIWWEIFVAVVHRFKAAGQNNVGSENTETHTKRKPFARFITHYLEFGFYDLCMHPIHQTHGDNTVRDLITLLVLSET
ncbi:unnamed protein product [Prunus brigantina]